MIYILEDDPHIRGFVEYALNNSGSECQGFEKPSALWAAIDEQLPQLLLLDIMLPEEDGLSVLEKLRSRSDTRKLPVIMLTAKGTEYDKVLALDGGADDYVTKPFGMLELLSRIKALLRRVDSPAVEELCSCGKLIVNLTRRTVLADGQPATLTYKEFELLCLLMTNPGTVFTRDQLLHHIWNFDYSGESRTVDVHIRTLRSKLGDCGGQIQTVRGVGYKIEEEPA